MDSCLKRDGSSKSRLLVFGRFPDWALDRCRELELDCEHDSSGSEQDLLAAVQSFQPTVLFVRTARITSSILAIASRLSLVVRLGTGFDNIDLDACRQRNTAVANCPGIGAAAVAELAFGLILALDRRIP